LKKEPALKINFRQKLTLTYLLLILVIVSLTALLSWWQLSMSAKNQLDQALLALAETEADMLASLQSLSDIRIHDRQHDKNFIALNRLDRLVEIVDEQGQSLAKSRNLGETSIPITPQALKQHAPASFETIDNFHNEPLRVVVFPVYKNNHYYYVLVAGSMDDIDHILNRATLIFILMAVALACAILWAGRLPIDRTLKVIQSIVSQTRDIHQESLNQRLSNDHTDDEIGELINTLNAMLERLENAFTIQKSFTSHASHELKSPLSRMRTDIEIALRRSRDKEVYQEVLRSCLDEVDHLTKMLNSMLLLAQLDSNIESLEQARWPLHSLITEVLQPYQQRIHQQALTVTCEIPEDITVITNREFALLMIGNLVENAVKFTLNQQIMLEATQNDTGVQLKITDFGPGIPADEVPFIFDRFYRGRAVQNEIPGSGLGLALVKTLTQYCLCTVTLSPHPAGGCMFTIAWAPQATTMHKPLT
jgi:two-component system OmpR family sensor kinase